MNDAQPDVQLDILSQPRLLTCVRGLVTHLALRLGFDDGLAGRISLALDEALCNVINHGYERRPDGRIRITIRTEDGPPAALHFVIDDEGKSIDPALIRPRDLDDIRPGGLGVHIIREIMDDVRYEQRPGGGMRLTMSKRQGHAAHPAACTSRSDKPSSPNPPPPAAPDGTPQ